MNILAIDSSAKAASVAIIKDGQLIGEFFINTKITHSQTLMPMVESALNCTKTDISQIDKFAVSVGPGSFTGVRIGVCAIKGMALAQNKPCVAVSTLLSLAYNLNFMNCIICAAMDARRSQLYNAIFEANSGKVSRLCEDRTISIAQLADEIKTKYTGKKVVIIGDGAHLCYNELSKSGCDVSLAPEHLLYQRASSVGFIASEEKTTVEADKLVPFYLRLAQAERERLNKISCEGSNDK